MSFSFPSDFLIEKIVISALQEDIGWRDLSSCIIAEDVEAKGLISSKEEGILCGIAVARKVFEVLQPDCHFLPFLKDGDKLVPGSIIAKLRGKARTLLGGERVALNFLQHLSGIATLTKKFVEEIKDTGAKILATRKTLPLLRALEKYAVEVGGGMSHRFALYDGVLIKDNHIALVGSVEEAVRRAKGLFPYHKIEVEVSTLEQLEQAMISGADIVLLDNMNIEQIKEAVRMGKGKVILEVSGGVTLENVREIAETGVDFISVGALTHSPKAIDIHMEVKAL
ncbi:carboxylating nicotinate-nucleotide diphosphorylase [bacterium]|nr:carboxylating nicotinate-nucleotide diphosphorylase [bacterium]